MVIPKLTTLLNNSLSVNQAKQIHAHVVINTLNHLEPLLVRQILLSTSYYSRSIFQYVQKILHHLVSPDAFSWGFAVRYLSQHGQFKEAFCLYIQQQRVGLCPTTFAVSSALKACARGVCKIGGLLIHAQVYKYGFCCCVYAQTALVDLYSKLGDMENALKVFHDMQQKNVVSWNSILYGHLKSGNLVEARRVFDEMPIKDVISWNAMVSGYAKVGNDMDHACTLFQEMPLKNLASWNAIISGYVDCGRFESARSYFDAMPQRNNVSYITMMAGYSKCGDVESARGLFNQLSEKDILSYNAMIACYSQNSQPKEALLLFNQMLEADLNVQPDGMTLASVISACSQLGDMRFGSFVKNYIDKLGIEMDDHLTTALIDLYAKCGSIYKAFELFRSLRKKDLVAYSALILGCGINGKTLDAVKLFEKMVNANIRPNLVTFTGLLTAYNHAGLVEEGCKCFSSIMEYGFLPSSDHYGIMVDLLGRAGRLEEAYNLIKDMPMQPDTGVWGALLLACRVHNNVEFGEIAAQHCFELEPDTTGYYLLLANIYSSVGRWEDARELRKVTEQKKLAKISGCSWIKSS
ncbi:PPR domain-containing protein/PPR_2 domain-containing protein/TPR_7 domain-containing protein/PPR_3 domain-containing protein [Cephalotus follicularis]|uniref:PPR domain-containing protein/PPR_2 domain-containing protein/TPR_7 domain-containing protein/PPR_3 domain-containing protein n=1 Tax=Cephalotus follicularis TaxID=3775 RepID=A0A1Q3CMJ4_CEPFO|nr:PPR domain-containing protein/PPR_2 domain-containing protein/TPR_7 domain-containing protein/PPR_3 domain-containing protein [Cephalotus follicularis]